VDETPDDHGLRQWKTKVPEGSSFYSYVMNNYWHTNYAADQPGPASIAYALYPHGIFNATDAYRRGIEQNQPLITRTTTPASPLPLTLFGISVPGVVATSVKPSADGKAVMVRLFNCGGKPESFGLLWKGLRPVKVYRSSVFESKDADAGESLSLPAFGILTLRCER
jgi:alpha-mannosidase